MSNQTMSAAHYDSSKSIKSRFLWVKRLIQSRTNPTSSANHRYTLNNTGSSHNNNDLNNNNSHKNNNKPRVRIQQSVDHEQNLTSTQSSSRYHQLYTNETYTTSTTSTTNHHHFHTTQEDTNHRIQDDEQGYDLDHEEEDQNQIQDNRQRTHQLTPRFDINSEADDSFDPSTNHSTKASSKTPSIAHDSINTKADNISTLPVISMSTASVRSSTFSEHSQPSTSGTVLSDHPTVYTNASTVGIPPASIMDRRERIHNPISLNHFHLNGHNNSSHTVNTAMSPTSALPNECNTDISSLKS